MEFDPLGLFPHEKAAREREIPYPASRDSDDPGERAIAGWAAAMASPITKWVLPIGGRAVARNVYGRGSRRWNTAGVQGAKNINDALNLALAETPGPRSKVLGVVPVSERPRPSVLGDVYEKGFIPEGPQLQQFAPEIQAAVRSSNDAIYKATPTAKLKEIQDVVDSFIDKHRLAEKGVKINIQGGPASQFGGGKYNIHSKEVTVPRVSKEGILHELGHAADYTSRMGKVRGVAEPFIRRGVDIALPIALVAGDRIKEMLPGTVDDKAIEFMQTHAPAIMGASLAATTLYPEAKASFLAVRHIAEKEGPQAARAALGKLIPFWGTYLLGAVPAVVGMSLARKYMRESRGEKTAGLVTEGLKDLAHVGKELGRGTIDLIRHPGTMERVVAGAREVGTSPEFVMGALTAGVPAAVGALYLYGTPAGKTVRERMGTKREPITPPRPIRSIHTSWREENPGRFAGLVGLGAALSGGIMTKFISDLTKVL